MSIGTIQADGLLTGYGGIPTHNLVTMLCASNSAILTRVFELPVANSRAVDPGSLSGEGSLGTEFRENPAGSECTFCRDTNNSVEVGRRKFE